MLLKKSLLVTVSLIIIVFFLGLVNLKQSGVALASTSSSSEQISSFISNSSLSSSEKIQQLVDPVTSSASVSVSQQVVNPIPAVPQPIITPTTPVAPSPTPLSLQNPLIYGLSNDESWDTKNFGSNRSNSIVAGPWILDAWEDYHSGWLKKFLEPGQENTTPYIYSYIIAGLARADGLVDCNVGAPKQQTLCYGGSKFIRNNEQKILTTYIQSANGIRSVFGTSRKLYIHLEPDYFQYAEVNPGFGNATTPLTKPEAWSLMNKITDQIKAILPNAQLVIDVSSWNEDLASWHNGFKNISYGGMVGRAFNSNGQGEDNYRYISSTIGKKLFVNVSHGIDGALFSLDQSWYSLNTAMSRFNDGVIGVMLPP
jgi:hypothetical protein